MHQWKNEIQNKYQFRNTKFIYIYSSGDLDDEQMYDHDSVKRNYIMLKTTQKERIENQREKREKKNHRSIKGCISSQTQLFK